MLQWATWPLHHHGLHIMLIVSFSSRCLHRGSTRWPCLNLSPLDVWSPKFFQFFVAQVPSVHQPVIAGPSQKSPVPAQQAAPVVEKIYLRDQAVQSDPPPLGFDDNIIKDGCRVSWRNFVEDVRLQILLQVSIVQQLYIAAHDFTVDINKKSSLSNSRFSHPKRSFWSPKDGAPKTQGTTTSPPARPLGALDRAHLLSGGPVAKPTVAATTPVMAGPSVAPGESAPVRRELRWKFEDEDHDQIRWNHENQICIWRCWNMLKLHETARRDFAWFHRY